jgi:CRISPR-associated protein Cas1
VPVEAHEGSRLDFLRRHAAKAATAARGSRRERGELARHLLPRTADPRNLRLAWDYLASGGGDAPGPDGLRYHDLDEHEVWDLLRALGMAVANGQYTPGPDRKVTIPKTSGTGTRTLELQSIIDRVVQRAVVQTLQPLLDPQFSDYSLGFRPGRGREDALLLADRLASAGNRWVWAADDIEAAFDRMPRERLLDVVHCYVPDTGMTDLIENIVHKDGTGRGVRQGGCFSPLLLNLYLHRTLDGWWARTHPATPLLRSADDLLLLASTHEVATAARTDLTDRLRTAGMPVKPSKATTADLQAGESTRWLGYRIDLMPNGLRVRMDEPLWGALADRLAQVHRRPAAGKNISGWWEGAYARWVNRGGI